MRKFVVAASIVVQSLGAGLVANAQAPAKSISIPTPLTASQARSRVVKALLDGGYVVTDTSAFVIHTERRAIQHVVHLELFAKFLAVDEKSTRIVLTGNYTVDMMHEDPIPVEEASNGTAGEMWDALSEIGERVRRAVSP